eukprot:g73.t1
MSSTDKDDDNGDNASTIPTSVTNEIAHPVPNLERLWLPDWSDDEDDAVKIMVSVAGAWRGPIQTTSISIVRDLKRKILAKSGIKVAYQRLSYRKNNKTIVLDDEYRSLRSYGVESRLRILLINAKPDEDARLARLQKLREKKKRRKHETLKEKLERQKRRALRAQQLSDWRLDTKGNLLRQGRVTYPDGAVYDGQWCNQKRHGKGVLVESNGDRYEGMFENGVPHGQGIRVYAFEMIEGKFIKGGRKYDGEWRFGAYWGEGTYAIGNGETYEGGFSDGTFHGKGTYRFNDGRVYEGEWKRGRQFGFGTMHYPNGDFYEGHWKMDVYDGEGRLVHKNAGEMRGTFRQGVLHGSGVRVYADGRVFAGEFYHGERKRGRVEISREDEWYDGEWEGGWMHGRGEMRWRDGTRYVGEWAKGYPYGKGKMIYVDGGYYEGDFKARTDPRRFMHGVSYPTPNGLRHGFGVRMYSSGNVYRGQWHEDFPHGAGLLEGKNFRYEGTFVRGERSGDGTGYFFPEKRDATSFICPCGFCHSNLSPSTQSGEIQLLNNGSEKRDTTSSKMNQTVADRAFQFDAERTCIYTGQWLRGFFHGEGTMRCCDGRSYQGSFLLGKRHGHGTQLLVPKRQTGDPKRRYIGGVDSLYRPHKYSGGWLDDRTCGQGVTSFAPGTYQVEGCHVAEYKPHGLVVVRWLGERDVKGRRCRAGETRLAVYERGTRVQWMTHLKEENEVSLGDLSRGILWGDSVDNRQIQSTETRCATNARVTSPLSKKVDEDEDDDDAALKVPPGFFPSGFVPPGFSRAPSSETKGTKRNDVESDEDSPRAPPGGLAQMLAATSIGEAGASGAGTGGDWVSSLPPSLAITR